MKNKSQKVNIASRTSAEAASSPTPAFVINTMNGTDRVGRDVTSGHVIDDITSCVPPPPPPPPPPPQQQQKGTNGAN